MKRKNPILLLLIIILLIGCSNDDNVESNNNQLLNVKRKYIKEILNPSAPDSYRDEFFEFDNGLMTKSWGYTAFLGSYKYDSSGKLITKTDSENQFKYEYDNQNRIIKEIKTGTKDYIEIKYYDNKIITKRFYVFGGDFENGGGDVTEIKELELNDIGNIIKVTEISNVSRTRNGDRTFSYTEYEKYEYDDRGNIIKIISKHSEDNNETILELTYDDKINPYYIALEKYYNITYYLENFYSVQPYNWYGISPNNIVRIGSETITYEYDQDDYPIKWNRYYGNGLSSGDFMINYYE
ncbi:hypothetical protein GGR97_003068 [Wenyingzhuangia aestuarii]|nr:hypothetical protein [Wenyingzhuangia aestuarii]